LLERQLLFVSIFFFFFFFQAEDGIRDFHVTGVQTCALPIFPVLPSDADLKHKGGRIFAQALALPSWSETRPRFLSRGFGQGAGRSEERRVGKECRYRWQPSDEKKDRGRAQDAYQWRTGICRR